MSFAEQQARLRDFLDSDELYEETLDYVAAQGFLTALSICPEPLAEDAWMSELFARPPVYADAAQQQDIEEGLRQLKAGIERTLASDDDFVLPCEPELGDEPDDSDLRAWCIGFMEGVFLNEDAWFAGDEEEVSALLLPVMVLSGLFDEQEDFADMVGDPDLIDSMLDEIPGVVTSLFLLLQAPEEKPVLLKKLRH